MNRRKALMALAASGAAAGQTVSNGKEPVGIFQANILVILDEINAVGLQALQ